MEDAVAEIMSNHEGAGKFSIIVNEDGPDAGNADMDKKATTTKWSPSFDSIALHTN